MQDRTDHPSDRPSVTQIPPDAAGHHATLTITRPDGAVLEIEAGGRVGVLAGLLDTGRLYFHRLAEQAADDTERRAYFLGRADLAGAVAAWICDGGSGDQVAGAFARADCRWHATAPIDTEAAA